MRYASVLLGGLAALSLTACAPASQSDSAAVAPAAAEAPDAAEAVAAPATMTADEARATIQARNDVFDALFAARDSEGLGNLYTTDARIIPPDAPDLTGREAIAGYWNAAFSAVSRAEVVTDEAIPFGSDHILERAHLKLYGLDGELLAGGKAVVLWAQEDGEWKLKWDSWNNGPVE